MPPHRPRLFGCLLILALASTALSQPDSPDGKLRFAGPNPPAELQVLAPLIGEWNTKLETRPSMQDKEGYAATGHMTAKWVHNRHFIRVEGASAGDKYRMESTALYSYDTRKKVYRRWLFASNGLATESEGQWDAAKKTMTWKGISIPPNVSGGVTDVFSQDRIESVVHFERDDGQVMADATLIATRKKP